MADSTMQYLQTHGPAADPVTRLNWGLMAISILVCVIIATLLLLAIFRKRAALKPGPDGRLPVSDAPGGLRWITIGGGISAAVLLACAVWTIHTLSAVAAPATAPHLTLEVTSYQWWWEVKYLSDAPGPTLITANEIHIPVGEPVRLRLIGGDVIHSFWIPQLAGKTDMIPGQVNTTWLQADKAGEYRGQCGEYCGAQHAHMAMHVVAEAPAQFDAWRRAQLAEAAPPPSAQTLGRDLFMARCSACHAVRGTPAAGRLGPDLTHLMSRRMIAAGTLENNTGNLSGWVANAQGLKPGSRMPPIDLNPQELHAVVDYLHTLH